MQSQRKKDLLTVYDKGHTTTHPVTSCFKQPVTESKVVLLKDVLWILLIKRKKKDITRPHEGIQKNAVV